MQRAHLTLTWVTYVWSLVVVGVVTPLLADDLGVSLAVAGAHPAALAAGQVVVGVGASRVLRAWGGSRALSVALAGFAVAAVAFASGPWLVPGTTALAITLPAAAGVGGAGALVVTAVTTAAQASFGSRADSFLSGVHAWAAAAALLAPLVAGGGVAVGAGWAPSVLVVALLAAVAQVTARLPRVVTPQAIPAPRAPSRPSGRTRLSGRAWAVVLAVLCGVGIELAVLSWSARIVAEHTTLSMAGAAAAVSAVVAGIAAGRAVCTRLTAHVSGPRLLLGSVAVLTSGLLGLGLATSPAVASGPGAVAALAVTGLGIAALYPLGTAWIVRLTGDWAPSAMARVAAGSGIALGGAPLALGAIADVTGIRAAAALVLAALLLSTTAALAIASRPPGSGVRATHPRHARAVEARDSGEATSLVRSDSPGETHVTCSRPDVMRDEAPLGLLPARPAAVLLDMDGTLVDGEPIWEQAIRELLARHGVPWTAADQHRHIGTPIADNVRDVVEHARGHGVDLPGTPAEVEEELTAHVQSRLGVAPPWRPGALELVLDLLDWSVPVAMVTSSPRRLAGPVAAAAGIETVVTIDDVERPKPRPEPYLLAARLLEVDPAHCLAVEDSGTGVRSALDADCTVVHVPQDGATPPADERNPRVHWRPSLAGIGWIELVDVMAGRERDPDAPVPVGAG